MTDDDKQSKEFFGDSWLGRVLRGEEKIDFASTEPPEWPKLRETAHIDESGKISVSRSWYGLDGSKAIGDTILKDRNSLEYKEVMGRHPDLGPDTPSTFTEYHDGRWVLTRADEVLASGNSQDRQTA